MLLLVTSFSPLYWKHKKQKYRLRWAIYWEQKWDKKPNRNNINNKKYKTKKLFTLRKKRNQQQTNTALFWSPGFSLLLSSERVSLSPPPSNDLRWYQIANNIKVLAMPPPTFCKKLTLSCPKSGHCLKKVGFFSADNSFSTLSPIPSCPPPTSPPRKPEQSSSSYVSTCEIMGFHIHHPSSINTW